MSEQRQRVEAEARERYPDGQADEAVRINDRRASFIAGRTVTAEQVESAARAAYEHERAEAFYRWPPWDACPESERKAMRNLMRSALTAAGLLVEGDDDE